MLTINENPPAFASRAVGILEGRIGLNPINGVKSILFYTPDGAEIPAGVQDKAAKAIIENPLVLTVPVRALVYPRTRQSRLEVIVIDIEEAGDEVSEQKDLFLIQGFNIGSKARGISQLAIRANKRSKHQFEKFWLSMYGHLREDMKCVYRTKVLRKGRKLFIIKSDPILPKFRVPEKIFS